MKILIEKTDALKIKFKHGKLYPVLQDFRNDHPLGYGRVFMENDNLYADVELKESVKGYPSIGFRSIENELVLVYIGICENQNDDESIPAIEYTKQLDGKPNNLKMK